MAVSGGTGTGWLHVSAGPGHGVLADGAAQGDVGRWMGQRGSPGEGGAGAWVLDWGFAFEK